MKAEGLEDIGQNPEDYYAINKDIMISRIIDTHLYDNIKHLQDKDEESNDNDENEIE